MYILPLSITIPTKSKTTISMNRRIEYRDWPQRKREDILCSL